MRSRWFSLSVLVSVSLQLCASGFRPAAITKQDVPDQVNDRPIIAVLTVPLDESEGPCETIAMRAGLPIKAGATISCFTAPYARWIEAAGARVAFIPWNANFSTIDSIMDSVNGVLFTGGDIETLQFNNSYMQTAGYIYNKTLEKNDNGVFFPLHGTCQGMQVLSLLTSYNQSVLLEYAFTSENLTLPLSFVSGPDGWIGSRLFGGMPPALHDVFAMQAITLNNHHDAVPYPDAWVNNPKLSEFYYLVSINADRQGKQFVSTMEGRQYPVTATQWHPEQNAYNWGTLNISHTADAIEAMGYVAQFFVSDARRNNQSFADPNLQAKYSIYSYPLVASPDAAVTASQFYIFTTE